MEIIVSILIGGLFSVAIFLMLQRSVVKLIMGLVILSQASNLLIFRVGGLVRGKSPFIAKEEEQLLGLYADPLPEALILTAIVISFAVLAFSLVLIHRVHEATGQDDFDDMIEESG